jgi:hypothetical protein
MDPQATVPQLQGDTSVACQINKITGYRMPSVVCHQRHRRVPPNYILNRYRKSSTVSRVVWPPDLSSPKAELTIALFSSCSMGTWIRKTAVNFTSNISTKVGSMMRT